ncbi:hypothetical protein YerA41_124 [Yersinia phage YerA41]|nr:hypothetical protein YerA41_124 [Yersinia phage YerA41]
MKSEKTYVNNITESDLIVGSIYKWIEGEFCFDVVIDKVSETKITVKRLSDNRSQSFTRKKCIKFMFIK